MKAFLTVLATLSFLIPSAAQAATITVTSTADSGVGSLRDAIAAASPGDTITFSVTGIITLTTGTLTITKNLTISGPGASNLTISGNNAVQVLSVNSNSTVTISGATIEKGKASGGGGGILNSGNLTVTDSIVSGSSTNLYGGGIGNFGTLTLTNSTVQGNAATVGFGGGIVNVGTLTLTNSTVSGNSAAIFYGGGIMNLGTLAVTNSTISGNSSRSNGGGIGNFGMLTVKNTLLAANSLTGKNCFNNTNLGTIISQGNNLSDDDSCKTFLTSIGDMNSTAAGLDPAGLKDNGGLTPTIALLPVSAAVDHVPVGPTNYCTLTDGTTPVATDQRGVTRPGGSTCDIGAFEMNQTITVTIDIQPGEDPAQINSKSHGKIPVAVFSSPTFDAIAQVDPTSLTFGQMGSETSLAFCSGPQDVNGDGLLDLVCHFDTSLTGFQAGDTMGVLKGKTVNGNIVKGTDSVHIVH